MLPEELLGGTVAEPAGGDESSQSPHFPRLDLSVPLDEERKMKLAHRIVDELQWYRQAAERRRQNCIQWRLAYEMMPPGTANRWENSSDVNSPLSRIYTDSHHARLNQQIMGAVPPFAVIASDPEALENANRIEDCMRSVMDQAEWDNFADEVHGEISCVGNCFARVTWETRIEKHPRIVVEHDQGKVARTLEAGEEAHQAYWSGVKGVKLIHEEVIAYDGVKCKVIPWEDGFIFPISIRNPEDCYGIGEVYMLRGDQMMEGVRRGVYDEDQVQKLLAMSEDDQPLHRRERLDEEGLTDLLGGPQRMQEDGKLYREYECAELCWKMDVDDDGLMEWLVIVIHLDSRIILRLQYLEYEHGQPYYMMYRYIIRPNELFGMGIPELIASYQDADTAVRNQIIDHGDLALNWNGNIAYDMTSGYYPDRFVCQLGRGIKVENLAGIKPLPIMQLPQEHYMLSQRFKDDCDLLTATSNPSLGKTTDAGRTLGEVQIVQSASHMIFEDYAARVARQHAKVWDQMRWLVAQYGVGSSGMIDYRRTAAPNVVQFQKIPASILRSRVDLVPTGLVQLSDMGTRVQTATLARTSLMQDPLVAGNVEARMILNETWLRALRYEQRDKLLAAIQKGIEAQRKVQEVEQMGAAGGAPLLGPGGPGVRGLSPAGTSIPGSAVPGTESVNPAATAQTAGAAAPEPTGEEA